MKLPGQMVTPYNGWSADGCKCQISSLDMAKYLLVSSTVFFGDGTSKTYGKDSTRLTDVIWVDETQEMPDTVINLPQLGTSERTPNAKRYIGAVFCIEGEDLRLRARAVAHHRTEDFPEHSKLPRGEMRLAPADAYEERLVFKQLNQRLRELREKNNAQ